MIRIIFMGLCIAFLSPKIWAANPDSVFQYLKTLPNDTSKLTKLQKLVLVNFNKGIPDYDKLNKYIEYTLSLSQKMNVPRGVALCYRNMGAIELRKGNLEKSIADFQQMTTYAKISHDNQLLADSYSRISIAYKSIGDITEAIRYEFDALKLNESLNYKKGITKNHVKLAIYYKELGDLEKAESYGLKAKELSLTNKDSLALGASYSVLGTIYKNKIENQKSVYHYRKGMEIAQKMKDEHTYLNMLGGIAIVYQQDNQLDSCDKYLALSNELGTKLKEKESFVVDKLTASDNLRLRKKYKEAIVSFQDALRFAKENHFKDVEYDMWNGLAKTYQEMGDSLNYQKAKLEYYYLKDSITYNKKVPQIAEIVGKYEKDKKQKEVAIKETELKVQKQKTWAVIGGLVLVLLIAVVVVAAYAKTKSLNEKLATQYQEIERQKVQLQQVNQVKDKMFSIISHDLRNPLHSLLAATTLLKEANLSPSEYQEIGSEIEQHLNLTTNMLDGLLMWAKNQMQGIKVNKTDFNLNELVEEVVQETLNSSQTKNIDIQNLVEPLFSLSADRNMIKVALRNLINNAIKFTHQQGKVIIDATTIDNQLKINVKDTGVGIHPSNLPKLFDETVHFSTTGTQAEMGVGLGLILVKELVEKNGGKLEVESEIGKGTCFSILLNQN